MRVIIYGTSGSGKSTFAAALAKARNVACIELDLINWRPGWVGRNATDLEGFIADVRAAISADAWVATGAYSRVREMMWGRATDVVYLDLPRNVIMGQVIKRSLQRASSGEDVFPGCKENWGRLLTAEHPIRWAWSTYYRRREIFETLIKEPANAHLRIHRCTSRAEVAAKLHELSQPI
jgi:adenylate kinase family enzyme